MVKGEGLVTDAMKDPGILLAFAYVLPPVSSAWLLWRHGRDAEARFHAWQAIWIAALFAAGVVALEAMALSLGLVARPLGLLLDAAEMLFKGLSLSVWFACLVAAFAGRRLHVPLAGGFAQRMCCGDAVRLQAPHRN